MDYQTQVNSNGATTPVTSRALESAADLWQQILLLGELQARLLVVEVGEGVRQARAGVLLVVCGVVFGIVALPVVLAALALILVEVTELTLAQSFSVVAGCAIVVAACLTAGGWWRLRQQTLGAPRSHAEWNLNWRWLKETLHRERGPQHRLPCPSPRSL